MLSSVISLIFGDKQTRDMKRVAPRISKINEYFEQYQSLSDESLQRKTEEFRARLANGETLDDLTEEGFAVVKEACRRHVGKKWMAGGSETTWDMVPFDVQLAGGLALHDGKIAEMATGEGKTLVATLPLYLNALEGKGCHLITVNDYLAKRDSEWMGPIFQFLGLKVGCIISDMEPAQRREMYACDITYGTNSEFGFDYLRDNMSTRKEHLVQRGFHYSIVDEVDSVLIDEARTPLIISGQVDRSTHRYDRMLPLVVDLVKRQNLLVNRLIGEAEEVLNQDAENYEAGMKVLLAQRGGPKNKRYLKMRSIPTYQRLADRVENDYMRDKRLHELDAELFYVIDEKGHSIDLTEKGREAVSPDNPERFLLKDLVEEISAVESRTGLSTEEKEAEKAKIHHENEIKSEELHNISQLLRAFALFEKDVDYVVQDNKVIIVDEFTGRLQPGRRYSDGLHQALEAKEGVQIEKETQTLATITLQNYFRMYKKLAGMTGTAETEASEFAHTYKMDVVVIPTNKTVERVDYDDVVYRTRREKYNAIIEEITRLHEMNLPMLVGTVSVEVSETLSRMLRRSGISHSVLNAKYHQREAEIIREAGKAGAVTIATNMAGRGTDIKLGPGVLRCKAGGAFAGPACPCCPYAEEHIEREKDGQPCGLQIIGTERHEARRIDRQLRGRAGRQGDPGSSIFFVSLEDELMRLFGSDRISAWMQRLGMQEGEQIQHKLVTRSIGNAQKKIESINFERRKKTLEYDNVMNKQREAIYGLRREILTSDDLRGRILEIAHEALGVQLEAFFNSDNPEEWNPKGYIEWVRRHVPFVELDDVKMNEDGPPGLMETLFERVQKAYDKKAEFFPAALLTDMSRTVMLYTIDNNWRDHLLAIDELREGIHLRAYAQLDPLIEYQREATQFFDEMMTQIYKSIVEHLFRTTVVTDGERFRLAEMQYGREDLAGQLMAAGGGQQAEGGDGQGAPGGAAPPRQKQMPVRRQAPKTGRNDPCPCGSGKKYKKCCGASGAVGPVQTG
ncbi:MAG: preprotein translocase subunit SecA [bacterium]